MCTLFSALRPLEVSAHYNQLSLESPALSTNKLFYWQSLLLITSRCISILQGAIVVETDKEILSVEHNV